MTIETTRFLASTAQELEIGGRRLWAGILKTEKFRLDNFFRIHDAHVYSIEHYQKKNDPLDCYVRINFAFEPSSPFAQTLVVGPMGTIGRYAHHDHKLHTPLTPEKDIASDGLTLLAWKELIRLPGLSNFLNFQQTLGYYLRPSSFVCSEVQVKKVFGEWTKMVTMKYLLADTRRDDFFVHIHSPNEDEELWRTGVQGFVFTNSSTYVDNHAEIDFSPVPDPYADTFYAELGVRSIIESLHATLKL